jgi:UDP-2,3-diacylglucosamine pyrophosphatase LpxH
MIAVISDLHLGEEASDVIPGPKGKEIRFRRNFEPKVFASFIAHMADEVRRRKSKEFHLVIAGDLFDLNRTTLWFSDDLRPYVRNGKFSPALEQKVLRIIDATAKEEACWEALKSFRLITKGVYRETESGKWKERDFPCKVKVTLLAGNHDRIINGSKTIRRKIRDLLYSKGDDPFPHYLVLDDPETLIRHGHEYDPSNFASELTEKKRIPLKIDEEYYDNPNFGDFVTIDIAAKLPFLLRQHYGDEAIQNHRVLRSLYLRLLQFDDVRPQAALLDYLLDCSGEKFTPEAAWDQLVPVLQDLLEDIHDDPYFRYWLRRRAKPWAPAELDLTRELLKAGGWRNRLAREAGRKITHFMLGGEIPKPEIYAAREEFLEKDKVRLVISGHTHHPKVTLLKSDASGDRFYINTGTWRDMIPSTPDRRTFGRMRSLTYVMLYEKREQDERDGRKTNSFDYWNGFTLDW